MIIFQTSNQSQGLVWKRSDGHIYNLHAAGNRCSNCPMSALVTSSNGLGPACLLSLGSKTLPQDKIGLEIEARDVQVTTLLDQLLSVTGLNNIGQHRTTWKRDIQQADQLVWTRWKRLWYPGGIRWSMTIGHVGWGRERDNNLTRWRWTQDFYDDDECDGNEKIRAS